MFNRIWFTAIAFLSVAGLSSLQAAAQQPNIVFILADDLGWSELGCYGNRFNETPHLDRLAKQGMRFTQAYAAAPVCSPYRAALLTGLHPARTGILDYLRPNSANALSTKFDTLPKSLQTAGYTTGMIGKWHLTGYSHHKAEFELRPTHHGFDWNFGSEIKGVGNGANFWPYVFRDQPIRWLDISTNRLGENEYLTDRLNLEAVDFIERNKNRPFFLYLSHYAPHTILNGQPDLVAKYRGKHKPGASTRDRCYLCEDQGHKGDVLHHWAGDHNPHLAAMLESIDDGVGLIAKKLDELGLADNTIIIFTSDNGGETNVTSNAPLRGGKSQLYEGGIRVPLIVRWPKSVPANKACNQPTVNLDFYPTLLEAAGVELKTKATLDGVSTLDTWKDETRRTNRGPIYWHYPLDRDHFLGGTSAGAIRDGDWKLIESFTTGKHELYSLPNDISESRNVADANPDVVSRLSTRLRNWRHEVGATIPSPPLLARKRQLYFADHFSQRPQSKKKTQSEPEAAKVFATNASDRWFFHKDWSAENGVLQHAAGSEATRVFLKKPTYHDVVIRFDFQMQKSQDIRLITGSSGKYNAVIHIRPDHFYVQTAQDDSGPWFSYRHGECAFPFEPNRWYTMTVEIIGDQLVAHIDREHLAYAKHPILKKTRSYFALQVDQHAAAFDNVQIFEASQHPDHAANLQHISAVSGKRPVAKPIAEQYKIQKRNAHEWFYQRDAAYRKLVKRVDELDELKKKTYPEVFRSHKEFRNRIAEQRRKLLAEDPVYKETLFATYHAERAVTEWLVIQAPSTSQLPDSRKKREVERLRQQYKNHPEYHRLQSVLQKAQQKLQSAYPQLFITDQQIIDYRNEQRLRVENTPAFRATIKRRADAWYAQQDYLVEHDKQLAGLQEQLDAAK